MLVLTRKLGQEIVIDGGISVKVLSIRNGRIELGIVAPRHIVVNRAEVEMRRAGSNPINLAATPPARGWTPPKQFHQQKGHQP